MGKAIADIKNVKKAKGVEHIYVPGERSYLTKQERIRNGIPISPGVFHELCQIGKRYGVELETAAG